MNELFNKLITAGIVYEKHSGNYRRLILLNSFLFVIVLALGFFSVYNCFILENYLIAKMDFLAMVISIYSLYYIREYKRLERAIFLGTINLFFFFTSFIYVNQNQDFGLIWTIFFPYFAIVLNGGKRGLIYSHIFYAVVFYLAYRGISVWQDGEWAVTGFLRFTVVSVILTYLVYFMVRAQEISEEELEITRRNEAKAMHELKKISIIDPLTQLYNRRHFLDIFERQINISQRNQLVFALFIIDIDFFKEYNDTYGHLQGDITLCKVADALKKHMRRSEDYVFRIGGEEFSGICIDKDKEKIVTQIKTLLKVIEDLKIEHKKSKVSKYLSISIGVKIRDILDGYSFDEFYKEADTALYRAKNEGRNRMVSA